MTRHGVGLLKGAGIPAGPRSTVYVACGCCCQYHRADFTGDCREDSERFPEPGEDATEVIDLDDGEDH